MAVMRLVALTCAAAMILGVSGCSGSIAEDVYQGVPEGVEVGALSEDPAVFALGPERFAVVTWGSSSCRPSATSISVEAEDRVLVDFTESGKTTCTADMAATTHEFDLPGEAVGRPLSVILSFEGGQSVVHTLD